MRRSAGGCPDQVCGFARGQCGRTGEPERLAEVVVGRQGSGGNCGDASPSTRPTLSHVADRHVQVPVNHGLPEGLKALIDPVGWDGRPLESRVADRASASCRPAMPHDVDAAAECSTIRRTPVATARSRKPFGWFVSSGRSRDMRSTGRAPRPRGGIGPGAWGSGGRPAGLGVDIWSRSCATTRRPIVPVPPSTTMGRHRTPGSSPVFPVLPPRGRAGGRTMNQFGTPRTFALATTSKPNRR